MRYPLIINYRQNVKKKLKTDEQPVPMQNTYHILTTNTDILFPQHLQER